MKEYRIAFFTADWNYELVESTLHGLKRYVNEHENIRLCIFDCFGKDIGNEKDISEYMVYRLADLSSYDGVLIQGNQIVLNSAWEELYRRVVDSKIPAVTIGRAIPGGTMVEINNRAAQHDIAAHVITAHGARRLAYLTGILDNGCPEGAERLQGFLDACEEQHIPAEDRHVIHCTWRNSDGARVAREWLDEKRPLPDAFVCANDEMGLGLIEALGERGYTVPLDVMVVGYDNVSSAELSRPRLSTVHVDNAELNYYAMEVLMRKIRGEEHRSVVHYPHSLICSESCGCHEGMGGDYIRKKYFQQTRFLKNFYSLQDQMAEELFNAAELTDLMDIIEKHHSIFGCDSAFLCINDYYYDNYDKNLWQHDSRVFGNEMILAACGRPDYVPDQNHMYARFPTQQLLPGTLTREERFLVFYPLHYNTYSIGYVVLDGISEAAKLNLHESIFNFLEIAIENVRKKCLLRQLNGVLDDLYVRDALTGLYNRFGYKRFGQQTFDQFLSEDGSAQVLFIDMDDMKGINDRFGHECGDEAIRVIARALQSACRTDDFIMRYGGDEFLVIASGQEEQLETDIQRSSARECAAASLPCAVPITIGCMRSTGGKTLDACVQAADGLMYEKKNARKKAKTS